MRRPSLANCRLMPSPMPPKPARSWWASSFMFKALSAMANSVPEKQGGRRLGSGALMRALGLLAVDAVLGVLDQRQIDIGRLELDVLRYDAEFHRVVDLALRRLHVGHPVGR